MWIYSVTSRLPPPNYQHLPSLNRRPSPGSPDGSGCVREEGRWNSQVWRRVMRHTWSEWSLITAAVICRVRLSSGNRSLPRACTLVSSWVQEGSVEGTGAAEGASCRTRGPDEDRTRETADGPGCRAVQSPEAPRAEGGRSRYTKPPPLAPPDPPGEHVRPPDSAPYLDPSFLNTAHPSQTSQHDEDTRSPVYFGHFNPFRHFVLLFLFNKSLSEAWRHTHCVCRLLLPHNSQM